MLQLGRILNNSDSTRPKIYIRDNQIYGNNKKLEQNKLSLNRFATLFDFGKLLKKHSWLNVERKFISWDGDLVQNYSPSNYNIDPLTGIYKFNNAGVDEGISIRPYEKEAEMRQIIVDTSRLSVNLLGDIDNPSNEVCTIIFPEDEATSVNLSNLTRKFMFPGINCTISKINIKYSFLDDDKKLRMLEVSSDDSDNVDNIVNIHQLKGQLLFEFDKDTYQKKYNTKISEVSGISGIILDITEDGWFSIYPNTPKIIDCIIKECDVKFNFVN